MQVIVGPSWEHCEQLAARLAPVLHWEYRDGKYFVEPGADDDGEIVLFVLDPAKLASAPRHARIYDAFAGIFCHQLAAQFAEVLSEFDQFFYHRTQEASHAA